MVIWIEHFQCVEIVSGKADTPHTTKYGAANRCHELNKRNRNQRWTVRPCGFKYVPDYYELQAMK